MDTPVDNGTPRARTAREYLASRVRAARAPTQEDLEDNIPESEKPRIVLAVDYGTTFTGPSVRPSVPIGPREAHTDRRMLV